MKTILCFKEVRGGKRGKKKRGGEIKRGSEIERERVKEILNDLIIIMIIMMMMMIMMI